MGIISTDCYPIHSVTVVWVLHIASDSTSLTDVSLGFFSLMPLMITRLIISLKKAVEDPDQMWSAPSQVESVRFARRTVGGTEYPAGDIPLESISWGPGGGGPSRRSDQL